MINFELDFLPIHMVELNWAPNFDSIIMRSVDGKLQELSCDIALFRPDMTTFIPLRLQVFQRSDSSSDVAVRLDDIRPGGIRMTFDTINSHRDILKGLTEMITAFRTTL